MLVVGRCGVWLLLVLRCLALGWWRGCNASFGEQEEERDYGLEGSELASFKAGGARGKLEVLSH